MEEGKEHKQYSAEYLRKYLDGELSGPEMQALEKAALEDPFLSDALEGLEASGEYRATLTSDLTDLQRRLSARIGTKNRKKGILFRLPEWQVAASVLFIIGAATITYTLIFKGTDQSKVAISTHADTGVRKSEPTPATIAPDSGKPEKIKTTPDLLKEDSAVVAYQPAVKEKKSRLKNENIRTTVPAVSEAADFSKLKLQETNMDSLAESEKISSIAKNADKAPTSTPKKMESNLQGQAAGLQITPGKVSPGNYVQGIVVNDENKPIPYAIIKIKGSDKGISTDTNGYFKLYLNNANSDKQVVISSLGYRSKTEGFSRDSSLIHTYKLQLSSQSLNEVVVTGYGTEKREDITGTVTEVNAVNESQPQGWDSLYHYVDANKKITTADSVLKGEELVSFVVSKNGELSSFKIIKSVSPAHDAEIIRLIKSGPPLNIQKGRKQKCRISILFN